MNFERKRICDGWSVKQYLLWTLNAKGYAKDDLSWGNRVLKLYTAPINQWFCAREWKRGVISFRVLHCPFQFESTSTFVFYHQQSASWNGQNCLKLGGVVKNCFGEVNILGFFFGGGGKNKYWGVVEPPAPPPQKIRLCTKHEKSRLS